MISVRPLVRVPQLSIVADARRKPPRRLFTSASAPPIPTLVSADPPDAASTSRSFEGVNSLLKQKLTDLEYSLSIRGNPSRVWSQYTSLVNYFGRESLPLEMHQQVLRHCTPPSSKLRFSAARRLLVGNAPRDPHIHEGRFQMVIRAIRSMGMKPDLEDYHFILEQFAAVGHHVGSFHVYKELLHLGLQPMPKTFGLCFQAIAHRLTLPVLVIYHPRLIAETKNMTAELLSDMKKYGVSFTPLSLDLCMRILKETLDNNGFDSLMKWAYGIDLSNPDRPALEYSKAEDRKVDVGTLNMELPALPAMVPFSTTALNTTIDMLGRLGNVSKLVQAFEVLTQPLPQASQYMFSSFDDDDFGVTVPVSQTFNQYAEPNTATYTLLIRHLCHAGHVILARHYLLQLMELDKRRRHIFRHSLQTKPLHKVLAPRISVNRAALLCVFGASNRDKHVGLMRWLNTKLPRIIKGKRSELSVCKFFHNKLTRVQALYNQQESVYSDGIPSPQSDVSTSSSTDSSFFTSSLLRAVPQKISSRIRWKPSQVGTALDADLDQEPAPTPSSESKPLNLSLHIELLERELRRIEQLAGRVDYILGRTIQRVKERLGRRVWGAKSIYLRSANDRVKISRARWTEIVNFKPRRAYPGDDSLQQAVPNRTRKGNPMLRIYRRPRARFRSYSSVAVSPVAGAVVPLNDPPSTSVSHRAHGSFSIWNYLPSFLR